ncbi:MAG TPA: PHP domain-containing protein [Candidatus Sulfotelmatobacter sp.]|nr:PHP domain-containing protein [Candidatus Sulfotelmatobacter sp.]
MAAFEPPLNPLELPLDAHLHTDLSPDADVPLDAYAALARSRHVAELAITDHLDFEPGAPAYEYADFTRRERVVREAAERWDDRPAIRFGVEITYQARYEADIREHLRTHAYDYTIGSVHVPRDHPLARPATAGQWARSRTVDEAGAWYWDEIRGSIRSGLFDTIGHLDVIKRWLVPLYGPFEFGAHEDLYEGVLREMVEHGTALEVNSSGLRTDIPGPFPHPGETYPTADAVAAFRALGGTRVVAGSDAHRVASFAGGLDRAYDLLRASGFERLAFRRGGAPVEIDLAPLALAGAGA